MHAVINVLVEHCDAKLHAAFSEALATQFQQAHHGYALNTSATAASVCCPQFTPLPTSLVAI
jgi:hypothetical protein